jgi:hypothetical protein
MSYTKKVVGFSVIFVALALANVLSYLLRLIIPFSSLLGNRARVPRDRSVQRLPHPPA